MKPFGLKARPTILFASEMRAGISGNLLRIRDRMVERGLDELFDLRYHFRTVDMVTAEGTATLRAEFMNADIVLIDDHFPLLRELKVPEETRLIQVWHAGSGFKSVGYSRFGNYGSPKLDDTHRKYTFAITGSKHLVPVYSEVFGIPPEAIIPTGLPRVDTFLDPERAERVKAAFTQAHPQFEGKKKVLFAPTFRGRGVDSAFYDYSKLNFERLYEACGDEYVLLFRMHHFVSEPVPIPEEYADRMFDFSHFPDTNDLLHSIDLLVTDYSSIIYEFSLLNRPMIFFAYDRDLYSATRGFHRDYDEMAPGPVCLTSEELASVLESGEFQEEKIERFRTENFDHIDTHSADRVIDQLIINDPRTSVEVIQARVIDARRLALAQRLAAEQTAADWPEHEGARRALEALEAEGLDQV
ncbi:MAG: CDP-glycerol glycerophosphotransferase family protein [Microbacterium sp.]